MELEPGSQHMGESPDEELRARVLSCQVRCEAYGLTEEHQILGFLEAGYLLGEDFDSAPGNEWAAEVLTDPGLSLDERVAMLLAIAELIDEDRPQIGTEASLDVRVEADGVQP